MFKQSFIDKVKAFYPKEEKLHEGLDRNEVWLVGKILYDLSQINFTYDTILNASSLKDLQDAALMAKQAREIFLEFSYGDCFEK